LQGVPLEVHGDGEQSRDFSYIDNVVDGNLRAMETPGVSGEVFNIACGSRHSLLAIAAAIENVLCRSVPRPRVASRTGGVRPPARRRSACSGTGRWSTSTRGSNGPAPASSSGGRRDARAQGG